MPIAFTFDQAKCTGCQACILACTIENNLDLDRGWRNVYTFNERHHPDLPVLHLSLACNHCDEPACSNACPANAYSKEVETGFVVLDESKCIGCRYCTWACPYHAPLYDEAIGVVGKCTFCNERQQQGLVPACVASCPTGALGVGDRPDSAPRTYVPGFPATVLGPAITIEPAAEKRGVPECTAARPTKPFTPVDRSPRSRLAMTTEWPLPAFTFLTTLLVALLATSVFTGRQVPLFVLLGTAASAMLSSTAHLGKKLRAWRAVLNPARSWLSREILCFILLVGFGAWHFAIAPGNRILAAFVVAIGALTLVSIDKVYDTLQVVGGRRFHSAGTVLTGVFLTGVLLNSPPIAAAAGGGKLLLYAHRKVRFFKAGMSVRLVFSSFRFAFGFLVPGTVWALAGEGTQPFVIASVMFGELVDRFEFYLELDLVTPERQITIDLQKELSGR